MSCFDVNFPNLDINTIIIENSIGDQPSSINTITSDSINTIEINNCSTSNDFNVKDILVDVNTIAIENSISNPPSIMEMITYDHTNVVEIAHCLGLSDKIKDIISGSGILVTYNSGIYTISLSDPNLTSSDISDFLESVQDIIGQSGLSAGNYVNLNYNDSTGLTTISVTGLQPSGNYSVVGHSHVSSDITDFASGVSGLLPKITGINYVTSNFSNNIYSIGVTGLQPSGNYSLVGHTHTSSSITDFNSSVSGLLPVKNIVGGSGIIVSSNSGIYTISSNSDIKATSLELICSPYYAGNPITIYQKDSTPANKVYDHIDNNITLTRGTDFWDGGGGLYNSDLQSGYNDGGDNGPSGTEWNADGWDNLSNITTRTYTSLYYALGGNIGLNITNAKLIMHDTINNKYYKFDFSYWQPGAGQNAGPDYAIGGFKYTRTLLWVPTTPVSFTRPANSESTVDTISSGLIIKRNTSGGGGIYNAASESGWNVAISPSGTLWNIEGWNNLNNVTTREYLPFYSATGGQLGNVVTSRQYIMRDTIHNKYYKIKFNSWGSQGSFSYTRELINGYCNSNITFSDGSIQNSAYSPSVVSGLLPSITGSGYITSNFINNVYTIGITGLQPSGNYSLVGHSHLSSDITDFNSSVSGLLPVKNLTAGSGIGISSLSGDFTISVTGTFGLTSEEVDDRVSNLLVAGSYTNINYNNNANTLTISVTGLQPSGNYANAIHNHTSSDITNFNSSVSGLLPSVTGSGYVTSNFANNIYTIGVTGLQPSGNYSVVGHTHLSSDITDFNSSVSGLIPVKNIVGGSGIGVSSLSGTYTISTTGNFGLTSEEVDDRISNLLVAGTGVSLTYNDPSGILTIDNLHSEINVLSQEPQGFVNRTDSLISFNDATRTFTIQPAISGGSYLIYAEGVKVVKSNIETVVIESGTALNYIHFDTTPPYALHTKTTGFNFDTDIPIAFIHWNSNINQSTFFGEERHGIRMDSVTHKWIHNTFGMQYISGLSIGGYTLLGNGSLNSHAQIDISDGVLYQEDIIINITDDNGANSSNEFVQPLTPIAYIPTYYHSGSTGQWVRDVATSFPLKYNATRAQYNLYSGGTWTTPNVTNNRYFAIWIVATNDMNDPILAIIGQREDASLTAAESNNNWSDINLTNIPTQELRPLYRLIFVTNDTFTNTPKSSLQSILDIRKSIQSVSAGVTQNDHGSLFGLGDDDHSQYVHIDNNRTISAVHNFSNGLTAGGLISAATGSFNSLNVDGTGVSLVGHTHTSSQITDFNSSVSGLLPVKNIFAGSGIGISSLSGDFTVSVTGSFGLTSEEVDDRVSNLLVAGSYTNLNYDDNANTLTINVTGLQPSGNYSLIGHTHTTSEITNFNTSVSGLLPTISNSGDNRILTSTGSSVGINAENNLTFDGSILNIDGNLVFDSFTESVVSIGSSSSGVVLSIGSGTVQTCTLTNNCTFTMPTAIAGKSFTMFLNSGSGNFTASFSGVLWSDSAPPTITTSSSKVDILNFISDGSYWYGSYSQNYG